MSLVDYELRDQVAWVTLADHEHRNAIGPELTAELDAAIQRAETERARVLVLRSADRFFSVGGDLAGFVAVPDLQAHLESLTAAIHAVIERIQASDVIVVSVVSGAAAGAGFPLAAAADVVLADETARFTLGYTRIGLTGDAGTGLLARSLGLHRTLRLALLNEVLGAEEAERIGLVTRVFASGELAAGVQTVVAQLAAGPASAQAAIKKIVRAGVGDIDQTPTTVGAQLQREAEQMTRAVGTGEPDEGIRAFLEKRSPRFGGQPGEQSAEG